MGFLKEGRFAFSFVQASELLSRQLVPPKPDEGGSLGDGGC
jgi:hypothetical protein